jgi:hypothetical protein
MLTLLDTHAWVWWVTGDRRLSAAARRSIERGGAAGRLPARRPEPDAAGQTGSRLRDSARSEAEAPADLEARVIRRLEGTRS